MKFTKSQRTIHQSNFNPPANYYEVTKQIGKKQEIFTGSLAGPVINNNHINTFGYSKRFEGTGETSKYDKNINQPGPGQYFSQKKQVVYNFNKDLTKPKDFLKNTFRSKEPTASIPYKALSQENLDEQDKKFLKQLSLVEDPNKAAQKLKKKQPSYSFSKSPRSALENLEMQKNKQNIFLNKNQALTYQLQKISENEYQKSKTLIQIKKNKKQDKKQLILLNETLKKCSNKRNQAINNIGPDFMPSLQLIELMNKMRTKYVPGPGSYNNEEKNQNNYAIERSQKKGITISNLKRFDLDKKTILGPGFYDIKRDLVSNGGKFTCKQKRKLFNLKQEKDLEHRFYIDPDLQSKVSVKTKGLSKTERSASSSILRRKIQEPFNAFGSCSQRFSVSSLNQQVQVQSCENEYAKSKKNKFKSQLKVRIKKLNSDDRRSTKQDSGLLGMSTIASSIE